MLSDLKTVIQDVIQWGKGISHQLSARGDDTQPRVLRLVNEACTSRGVRKAGRIAQNLALIALYISFLMEV